MAPDLELFRIFHREYDRLEDDEVLARLSAAGETDVDEVGALLDVPGTRPPIDPRPPEVIEAEAQRLITERDARPTPGLAPTPDDPLAEARTLATEARIAAPPPGAIATERLQPRPADASIDLAPVAKGAVKGVARGAAAAAGLAAETIENIGTLAAPPGTAIPRGPAGKFADEVEKRLKEIPYEKGMGGFAEVLGQFIPLAGPAAKLTQSMAKAPLIRGAATTGIAAGAGGLPQFFTETDAEDSIMEKRLKAAAEWAVIDATVVGTFAVLGKAWRAAKNWQAAGGANPELALQRATVNPAYAESLALAAAKRVAGRTVRQAEGDGAALSEGELQQLLEHPGIEPGEPLPTP